MTVNNSYIEFYKLHCLLAMLCVYDSYNISIVVVDFDVKRYSVSFIRLKTYLSPKRCVFSSKNMPPMFLWPSNEPFLYLIDEIYVLKNPLNWHYDRNPYFKFHVPRFSSWWYVSQVLIHMWMYQLTTSYVYATLCRQFGRWMGNDDSLATDKMLSAIQTFRINYIE